MPLKINTSTRPDIFTLLTVQSITRFLTTILLSASALSWRLWPSDNHHRSCYAASCCFYIEIHSRPQNRLWYFAKRERAYVRSTTIICFWCFFTFGLSGHTKAVWLGEHGKCEERQRWTVRVSNCLFATSGRQAKHVVYAAVLDNVESLACWFYSVSVHWTDERKPTEWGDASPSWTGLVSDQREWISLWAKATCDRGAQRRGGWHPALGVGHIYKYPDVHEIGIFCPENK